MLTGRPPDPSPILGVVRGVPSIVSERRRRARDIDAVGNEFLKRVVVACLDNDAAQRPSARELAVVFETLCGERSVEGARAEVAALLAEDAQASLVEDAMIVRQERYRADARVREELGARELEQRRAALNERDHNAAAARAVIEERDALLRASEAALALERERVRTLEAALEEMRQAQQTGSSTVLLLAALRKHVPGVRICDGFQLARGHALACAGESIYVPSFDKRGVAVLTREGEIVRYFGAGELSGGCGGVAVTGGHVFATNDEHRLVMVFRAGDGALVRQFLTDGIWPRAIAAADGLLFISHSGHTVEVFREDGTHVRTIGYEGSGNGALRNPIGVAVLAGEIFVAEYGNDRVSVFRADTGAFLRTFGTEGAGKLSSPSDVCVFGGLAFVADERNRLAVFSAADGSHVATEGVAHRPCRVCVGDDGVLYFTCRAGIMSIRLV